MPRIILLIDMDYFFAQIEERENPQFKGEPVVVGAEPKGGLGRGVVSTANYIARQYGIHSALPITRAYGLCPEAIFLPVNMELYQRVSVSIMEIIKTYSPLCEIVSLDEAYLDVSFLRSYEKARQLAVKLKQEILEKQKLTSTIGLGPNKTIAKIAASQAKPDGLLTVEPKAVDAFLEPQDVRKLPGVGPKTAEKLRDIGIEKIKELKAASHEKLVSILGSATGECLYQKARGIDDGQVVSEEITKSISREYTFEQDTRDPKLIFDVFDRLLKELYQESQERGFKFRAITARCRYQGFETHTKSITFKKSTADMAVLEREAKKLLLKFLIASPKMIRLIGARLSGLEN